MALEITWYNTEKTALLVHYEPGWTWEQHHELMAQIEHLREVHHLPFNLCLFDLRGTTLPFDSTVGPHYRDPREGAFVVLVLDNIFTRTIAQLAIRARGHQDQIQIASTIEEGKALLDKKLADISSSQVSAQRKPHS